MTLTADIHLGYSFGVRAGFDEVFGLLSDVPASVAHFPRVQRLVPLGKQRYRWEMEPVGPADAAIRTVYACDYRSSKARGTVRWTPVQGEGNAQVSGSWTIRRQADHTALELDIRGVLQAPLPAWTASMVVPLIQAEFEQMIERYIDRLIDRFGGEV